MHNHSQLKSVNEDCQDLTIVIFTFDSASTICPVLDQLGTQEVDNLKVLIVDTGSIDGTPELIEAQIQHGWWKPPVVRENYNIELVRLERQQGGKAENIIFAMKWLMENVKTPYFMRVDSDIMLSPNTIKPLLAMFKERGDLGMLTVTHNPQHSPEGRHVSTGCTMFKTEDAKKIIWQWDSRGCECNHAQNQYSGLGLKCEFHPDLMARHLKFL